MRLSLVTFVFSLIHFHGQCQILLGNNYQGGDYDIGTFFTYDLASQTKTVDLDLKRFIGSGGSLAPPIQASDGLLYGALSSGTLYSYNTTTLEWRVLCDFQNFNIGTDPSGNLLQASDGKLYGVCYSGGQYGYGTIYKYDINTQLTTCVHNFQYSDGLGPVALVEHPNGLLYGACARGGNYNDGVLFSFNIQTNALIVLHHFETAAFGDTPNVDLILSTNGKLYGTTRNGGIFAAGAIYSYDILADTLIKCFDLQASSSGSNPEGGLAQGAGYLYGFTISGGTNNGGTLFKFNTSTNQVNVLLNFAQLANGSYPSTTPYFNSNGKLYGISRVGGTYGYGVYFSYDTLTGSFTKLHEPNSTYSVFGSGRNRFIQATNGKLYAHLGDGGGANAGCLISYDIVTNSFRKEFDFFLGYFHGSNPFGQFIHTPNGKLYTTVSYGGDNNHGTLISYNSSSGIFQKEADFLVSSTSGGKIKAMPTLASNGKLYVCGTEGGPTNGGTLFSFDTASRVVTQLHLFQAANGVRPTGALIEGINGVLYGTTGVGGQNNFGTLFSYNIVTGVFTKHIDFSTTLGKYPTSGMIKAPNGKLYGTTESGGQNNVGTLFSFDPSTNTFVKLFDFSATTSGDTPCGRLEFGANGRLYGLCVGGGFYNQGTLFSYNISTGALTKHHDFSGSTTGAFQNGGLYLASNGKMYGMSQSGGLYNGGTIYEFNPQTNQCNTLYHQRDSSGVKSSREFKFTEICTTPIAVQINSSSTFPMCPGDTINLVASGASRYLWSNGSTNSSITLYPTSPGVVTVFGWDGGCFDSTSINISIAPNPVDLEFLNDNICIYASPFALTGGNPLGGFYSGPGVSSNVFNPSVAGPGTHIITYTWYDSLSQCSFSKNDTMTVDLCVGMEEGILDYCKVYPNPARNVTTFFKPNGVSGNFQLLSLGGQIIFSSFLEKEGLSYSFNWSVTPGIYHLVFFSDQGVWREKVTILPE